MKRQVARGVSLLTLCIFFFTQVLAANPGAGIEIAVNPEMPGFFRIDIPTELASLDAVWEAPPSSGGRVVLHIQNAHANYGAQKKIQSLLEYLNKTYAIKTIFVEGAAEDLNPDYLKLFPDKERNVELADLLAQQGELTGAELYLLETNDSTVKGRGIEDAALYRQNYEALKKVFGSETLVNRYLEGYEARLEALSSKIFTNDLRRVLSDWQKFEKGHREFMPYIRSLTTDAKRVLKLDLESLFSQVEWPQSTRLLVLQGMEKDLDTTKALDEKDKLVSFLKAKGVSSRIIAEVENFKEQRLSVRQGQGDMMQPRDVLEALIKEAGPKGFYFRDYPAFSLYAGYLILKSELDAKGLFEEIKVLFEKILDSLATGTNQKTLLQLYRDEELARKLLRLELSRRDWQEALGRKTEVQMDSLISRLKDLSSAVTKEMKLAPSDFEVKTLSPKFREEVLGLYGAAFSFYEFARQRESMFYEKINAVMGEGPSSKAVLITGGFHTDGMTDLFREHNISYGILTPRLMEKSDEKLYRGTMLQNEKQLFSISYLELANGATSLTTRKDQGFDPAKELGDLIKAFRSKLPKELATGQGVADTFNNSAAAKAFGITLVFDAETSKATGIDTYTIKGFQKFEGAKVPVARAEGSAVVESWTEAQISAMTEPQVKALTEPQIMAMSMEQIQAVTDEQMKWMSPDLNKWMIARLGQIWDQKLMPLLTRPQVEGMTESQTKKLTKFAINVMSAEQLGWLTAEQRRWLSAEQLAWVNDRIGGKARAETRVVISAGQREQIAQVLSQMFADERMATGFSAEDRELLTQIPKLSDEALFKAVDEVIALAKPSFEIGSGMRLPNASREALVRIMSSVAPQWTPRVPELVLPNQSPARSDVRGEMEDMDQGAILRDLLKPILVAAAKELLEHGPNAHSAYAAQDAAARALLNLVGISNYTINAAMQPRSGGIDLQYAGQNLSVAIRNDQGYDYLVLVFEKVLQWDPYAKAPKNYSGYWGSTVRQGVYDAFREKLKDLEARSPKASDQHAAVKAFVALGLGQVSTGKMDEGVLADAGHWEDLFGSALLRKVGSGGWLSDDHNWWELDGSLSTDEINALRAWIVQRLFESLKVLPQAERQGPLSSFAKKVAGLDTEPENFYTELRAALGDEAFSELVSPETNPGLARMFWSSTAGNTEMKPIRAKILDVYAGQLDRPGVISADVLSWLEPMAAQAFPDELQKILEIGAGVLEKGTSGSAIRGVVTALEKLKAGQEAVILQAVSTLERRIQSDEINAGMMLYLLGRQGKAANTLANRLFLVASTRFAQATEAVLRQKISTGQASVNVMAVMQRAVQRINADAAEILDSSKPDSGWQNAFDVAQAIQETLPSLMALLAQVPEKAAPSQGYRETVVQTALEQYLEGFAATISPYLPQKPVIVDSAAARTINSALVRVPVYALYNRLSPDETIGVGSENAWSSLWSSVFPAGNRPVAPAPLRFLKMDEKREIALSVAKELKVLAPAVAASREYHDLQSFYLDQTADSITTTIEAAKKREAETAAAKLRQEQQAAADREARQLEAARIARQQAEAAVQQRENQKRADAGKRLTEIQTLLKMKVLSDADRAAIVNSADLSAAVADAKSDGTKWEAVVTAGSAWITQIHTMRTEKSGRFVNLLGRNNGVISALNELSGKIAELQNVAIARSDVRVKKLSDEAVKRLSDNEAYKYYSAGNFSDRSSFVSALDGVLKSARSEKKSVLVQVESPELSPIDQPEALRSFVVDPAQTDLLFVASIVFGRDEQLSIRFKKIVATDIAPADIIARSDTRAKPEARDFEDMGSWGLAVKAWEDEQKSDLAYDAAAAEVTAEQARVAKEQRETAQEAQIKDIERRGKKWARNHQDDIYELGDTETEGDRARSDVRVKKAEAVLGEIPVNEWEVVDKAKIGTSVEAVNNLAMQGAKESVIVAAVAGMALNDEFSAEQMAEAMIALANASTVKAAGWVTAVRKVFAGLASKIFGNTTVIEIMDKQGLEIGLLPADAVIEPSDLGTLVNKMQGKAMVLMADGAAGVAAAKQRGEALQRQLAPTLKELNAEKRFDIIVVDKNDPEAARKDLNDFIASKMKAMPAISRAQLGYVLMGASDHLGVFKTDTGRGLMIKEPYSKDVGRRVATSTLASIVSQRILTASEADAIKEVLEGKRDDNGFFLFSQNALNKMLAIAIQVVQSIQSAA